MVLLRPDPKKVDGRYLLLALQSQSVRNQISWAEGTGSTVSNLRIPDLKALKIPYRKIDEQRTISHILGTLDDKIELNRKMNETLESMARALFKSWFIDFDPVRAKMDGRWKKGQSLPGLPAELWDLFPERFVELSSGLIPDGWSVGTFGEVAQEVRRSITPKDIAPDTPYIGLEHMPRRSVALSDWGNSEGLESNKLRFRSGEILFGKLRPYFHKVGVAPVDGVCSTDIVVLEPKKSEWHSFVLSTVSSDEFVNFTNSNSTGTKMPRTSWGDMERFSCILPNEELAAIFHKHTKPLVQKLVRNIHEVRDLAALRDSLLPKLISGEISVKELVHNG
jgi:type I restriction enzyme S subunit